MTPQVSVRLAVVGGSQFRAEMVQAGQQGSQAMDRIAQGSRSLLQPLQGASGAMGTFAGQAALGAASGGSFVSMIPQLLAGFGALNPLAAIAAGVFAGLAVKMFEGRDSAAEMAEKMGGLKGSIGGVQGAVSALEGIQRTYNETISQTGGASSSAAALVVSNSKTEFSARKEVLAVELELLRIRGQEQASNLKNLQDTLRMEGEAAKRQADRMVPTGYATLRENNYDPSTDTAFSGPRIRNLDDVNKSMDGFIERNKEASLQIRKLGAEQALTNLAIKRSEELMNTTFENITTGGVGKPADPSKPPGTKGASGAASKQETAAMKEMQKLFDETRTKAERYRIEVAKIEELYKSGAISTEVYQRKMAMLKDAYQSQGKFAADVATSVRGGMDKIFDGIYEGSGKAKEAVASLANEIGKMLLRQGTYKLLGSLLPSVFGAKGMVPLLNANGNAFSGGRVTAFAAGGVVNGPTLFPMRGGTGLMGEAGPEAIMPLTRIGGKLGVKASGGGSGASITYAPVIDARGADASAVVRLEAALARAQAEFEGRVIQTVNKASRQRRIL